MPPLPTDTVGFPGISDPHNSESTIQEQENTKEPGPGDQTYRVLSSSCRGAHANENKETVISSMQATGVALGLRRLPSGFYVVIHHSGLEWRTDNKRSSTNHDIVRWNGPIPIPSDPSAIVRLEIYASFEFGPMLSPGERLRKLTITTGQLIDLSEKGVRKRDGEIISPCSSISVSVERRERKSESSASKVIRPHCPTAEIPSELEGATNRGHNALSQYRRHGRKQDLEHSIIEFEWALSICPLDHPCRAVAHSNLATARFIHCRVENTNTTLEVPLGLYRNALASRPVGHVDRPSTLIQLAAVHIMRFEKQGDEVDMAHAESLLHEAMELDGTENEEKRVATFMLQIHARRRADARQGDGSSMPELDPTSGLADQELRTLSLQLLHRVEQFGDLEALRRGIAILEELVRSTPVWDDRYCTRLADLGAALMYRFQHLGDRSDLERAISTIRDALVFISHGHFGRHGCLSNLGTSLLDRYECLGRLSDLEEAIPIFREAVDITPDGHPHKSGYLSNLGKSFLTRFERLGEASDLERAILWHRNALDLTSHDHPRKHAHLVGLANSISARFGRYGELSDLEEAVSIYRDAVDVTPPGHPGMPGNLNNLGSSILTLFNHVGKLSDLEDAICVLKDAVALVPPRHPSRPMYLGNLGCSLFTRFQRLGKLRDLEEAISLYRDVVDLTPDDHPRQPGQLSNLANCFKTRFLHLGELGDLEAAISIYKNAIALAPDGHPHKPMCLNNLGSTFLARFGVVGELSDIEHAILILRDAVNLIPHSHPAKPGYLANLGDSFGARFNHLGKLSDLEDSVQMLRDAVTLTPYGHPRRPGFLSDLGNSFFIRFRHLGEPSDLKDAISSHRDAVQFTPDDHPDKPDRLCGFGDCLITRFEQLGQLDDLEDAISALRHAVDLTPHSHPRRASLLNSLGIALRTRFKHLGQLSDIEEAILMQRNAVDLTPHGHLLKARHFNNLSNSFTVRFKHLGDLSDLEDAISGYKCAVDLTPHGHSLKPARLSNLANPFFLRFERIGELSDLEQAISLYSNAALSPIGPINYRFYASQKWITCARHARHPSLLHAYSVAVGLLPQLAWIGLSLNHRYRELIRGADVVREAAAAALDCGFPETAVEWLEQGRSIVWGELFQLRSSYEELSSAHPDHAYRLRELSTALEQAGAAREKSLSVLFEQTQNTSYRATGSLQREVDRHRTLAIERDRLLQEIRRFPRFKQFLLRSDFSQLRASAHSGPVVVLNAAATRCDALIILANVDRVIHVPLPNFTFKRSAGLQNMLEKLLGHARAIRSHDRKGDRAAWGSVSWESLLSTLWNGVVKPVLDALAFSTLEDLSRIFWCPTGPFVFLPIHAAGLYAARYSQLGHKVSDFIISSYIPTLSILAPSPNPIAAPSRDLRLLVVRQPSSDGLSRLPGVVTEMEHIRQAIKNSPSRITLLESSSGTVEEVLALTKEADWVHFACHGIQDAANPTDSGLCLADRRRLKLRDIIALSRPRGGLAFLSACQTAMGDERLSDEAIHIAAGMLFAGYNGVIGTMWSISDKLAPRVARDVYGQLFRNATRSDYRDGARALRDAVERLREGGSASFVDWLPFIHVGL